MMKNWSWGEGVIAAKAYQPTPLCECAALSGQQGGRGILL